MTRPAAASRRKSPAPSQGSLLSDSDHDAAAGFVREGLRLLDQVGGTWAEWRQGEITTDVAMGRFQKIWDSTRRARAALGDES